MCCECWPQLWCVPSVSINCDVFWVFAIFIGDHHQAVLHTDMYKPTGMTYTSRKRTTEASFLECPQHLALLRTNSFILPAVTCIIALPTLLKQLGWFNIHKPRLRPDTCDFPASRVTPAHVDQHLLFSVLYMYWYLDYTTHEGCWIAAETFGLTINHCWCNNKHGCSTHSTNLYQVAISSLVKLANYGKLTRLFKYDLACRLYICKVSLLVETQACKLSFLKGACVGGGGRR